MLSTKMLRLETLALNGNESCLPLKNTYAQTTFAHNFSAVPSSLFNECHATKSAEEAIKVDPLNGWASLNFIGSTSISAPIGL